MIGDSPAAFAGLKVVEISQGMAGPMAGQLLADNGADVVKVEPPGGDWARSMPGFRQWNRGKRSVVLDLANPTDRDRAFGLLVDADVLIESVRGGVEHALGVTPEQLGASFPRLVHVSITGFGVAEEFENLPAYEGVVAARLGRFLGSTYMAGLAVGNEGDRPVFNVTPFGSYACACISIVGIVAALRDRATSGQGKTVRTSLLEGITAATMRMPFRRDGDSVRSVIDSNKRDVMFRGIILSFMTAECSDGRYIQMCARQPDHYKRWMQSLGLGHVLDDPRWANGPTGFLSIEDIEELDGWVREAMILHPQEYWMELFSGEFDVGADPFLTPAEFMEHPDMVANQRVVEIEDPEVGKTRQVGPLALLGSSASTIGEPAPKLAEHQALVDAVLPGLPATREQVSDSLAPAPPPLEGITILEAAYYVAGPLSSSILAELGARVIKLEPLAGDPFRATGVEFAQLSHGKESMAIDIKAPGGLEILDALIAKADVLVHSFRPGVPERLGLDYERVHELNPKLVYLYAGSYGSQGPQAHRPAFHSTPNALSGAGIVQAGVGNPPVDDSYPDPCAGLGVAAALAIGLRARDASGVGQYIETTMLTATAYVHSDMLVQYDGRPEPLVADQGQHGLHALYRLYETADGWLFLAALQHKEWEALAVAVDRQVWLTDDRFATPESRLEADQALCKELSEILLQRSTNDWEEFLSARGVPAARADQESFEHFLVGNTPHHPATHPQFGDYWRREPTIRVDGCIPASPGVAPLLGQHTVPLLYELGFTEEECGQLVRNGVVRADPS